jgi:DNA-binding NtrC family response regulator
MNSPFSGCRVFLVEDEMFVAWLPEDMLADVGCAVVGPASSVNQALAMIDAEVAAVVHVNLNGQMSYPIADALAAPFVLSTGYDKDTLRDDYRTFPVLQKPIQRSELCDTLAKLLTPKEPSVESTTADSRALRFSCPECGQTVRRLLP